MAPPLAWRVSSHEEPFCVARVVQHWAPASRGALREVHKRAEQWARQTIRAARPLTAIAIGVSTASAVTQQGDITARIVAGRTTRAGAGQRTIALQARVSGSVATVAHSIICQEHTSARLGAATVWIGGTVFATSRPASRGSTGESAVILYANDLVALTLTLFFGLAHASGG